VPSTPACPAGPTSNTRSAEPAGVHRVHVRPVPPAVRRAGQPQPDLILEHVRRRVDLDVQRPPQRGPHRRLVRLRRSLLRHAGQPIRSFFWIIGGMTMHRIEPTPDSSVNSFSGAHEPAVTIDSGDTIVVRSLDAAGYLERHEFPGDTGK